MFDVGSKDDVVGLHGGLDGVLVVRVLAVGGDGFRELAAYADGQHSDEKKAVHLLYFFFFFKKRCPASLGKLKTHLFDTVSVLH